MCEGKLYISEAPKTAVPVGATLAGWFLYIIQNIETTFNLACDIFSRKGFKKGKGTTKMVTYSRSVTKGELSKRQKSTNRCCNTQGNKKPMRGNAKEVGNVQRQGDVGGK